MFAPCFNIASAARRLAQLAELCKASSHPTGDPIHCAVAAWHGSWERPDNRFAGAVRTSAASRDMSDFEMPAGAGVEAADNAFPQQPLTRATASSAALDDRQRARQSPLFPVTARPSDRAPNGIPARDQPTAGEPKSGAQAIRLTATQPHADSLFVPRSAPQSATSPE